MATPGQVQPAAPTLPPIESIQDNVTDDDIDRLPPGYKEDEDDELDAPDPDNANPEGADAEPEEDADEDEGEEGDEGAQSADDARKVKLKGEDGTETEVTVGELKNKYQEFQKLDTFARKTHEELQQVSLKAHQAVEGNRKEYTAALQKFNDWIMTVVTPELQNVNLNQLAAADPAEYVRVKARIDTINSVLYGIQQEQDQQQKQSNEEGQKARASAVQHSQRILREAIPGWNDQVYSNVMTSAVKHYGFKPEEIGQVIDPRVVKMAHDAAEYIKLQGGKDITAKKVAKVPLPVSKPGQGRVVPQQAGRVSQARTNLRRTGSDQDAVKLLLSKGIR